MLLFYRASQRLPLLLGTPKDVTPNYGTGIQAIYLGASTGTWALTLFPMRGPQSSG